MRAKRMTEPSSTWYWSGKNTGDILMKLLKNGHHRGTGQEPVLNFLKTLPGSIITAHKASPKPLIVSNVMIFFPLANYEREQYYFNYTTYKQCIPFIHILMMYTKYWAVDQRCKKGMCQLIQVWKSNVAIFGFKWRDYAKQIFKLLFALF